MASVSLKRTTDSEVDGPGDIDHFARHAVGVIETGLALIRERHTPRPTDKSEEKNKKFKKYDRNDDYDGEDCEVEDATMAALRDAVYAARDALIQLLPETGEQLADDAGWQGRILKKI